MTVRYNPEVFNFTGTLRKRPVTDSKTQNTLNFFKVKIVEEYIPQEVVNSEHVVAIPNPSAPSQEFRGVLLQGNKLSQNGVQPIVSFPGYGLDPEQMQHVKQYLRWLATFTGQPVLGLKLPGFHTPLTKEQQEAFHEGVGMHKLGCDIGHALMHFMPNDAQLHITGRSTGGVLAAHTALMYGGYLHRPVKSVTLFEPAGFNPHNDVFRGIVGIAQEREHNFAAQVLPETTPGDLEALGFNPEKPKGTIFHALAALVKSAKNELGFFMKTASGGNTYKYEISGNTLEPKLWELLKVAPPDMKLTLIHGLYSRITDSPTITKFCSQAQELYPGRIEEETLQIGHAIYDNPRFGAMRTAQTFGFTTR